MTTKTASKTCSIDGFDALLDTVDVGVTRVPLWQVAELERHVDRAALLGGDDPPEPPYWAHLWSGARVLAAAVSAGAGRVVEVGCGLGLPGLAAAHRGARVTFVDRVATPLRFVRASARVAGLAIGGCVVGDFAAPPLRGCFDLVLAAEVLYDRAAFPAVAAGLRALVAPDGRILLTDAGRIDTRAFYDGLAAAGLAWTATETVVREEGLPVRVRLVELRRTAAQPSP